MTTATPLPAAVPPSLDSLKRKMDDRKRPLPSDADDAASSRKRQVKDENGAQMRMEGEREKDVENYQKDAILRQMKEYKRQKRDFEEQVSDLQKKCQHHDDHLRTIDAWFSQLLDEVRVLASEALPPSPPNTDMSSSGEEMYKSALLFADSDLFSEHLQARSEGIKGAIKDLFGRLPSASPEVNDLRSQLNGLLAKEKAHAIELRRAMDERDSLSERLESASYRYMTAEKKLDRAKSGQVLKLERAAMMGSTADAVSPTSSKKAATPKREAPEVNGDLENAAAYAEAETARREAVAAAEKQKAQLDELESENERLTNALSAARTKMASLSDDDYAETSLFKAVKSQYEDTIQRVNDLEATNVQLREEAQKLQAERTSYRIAVDEEHRNITIDTETQLARTENDLARVRNIRDELQAELSIRRTAEEHRRVAADQTKELAAARDQRICALESEVERLKIAQGDSPAPESESNLDELDMDTLKSKLRSLEAQYARLSNNELPSLEAAWKKTQSLASRKVQELADNEEHVARLAAEKAKADQKYFATMKLKDQQLQELRTVKAQNARSSEIVSQLKETEGKTRELVANLERQVAELKENVTKVELQNRAQEIKFKDATLLAEGVKKQIDELKALVEKNDKERLAVAKTKRGVEEELAKTTARMEELKKQLEVSRKAHADASKDNSDDWRKVAICPVCNTNLRNTVFKLCGHVFCSMCVNDLIRNRSRKCPSCGKAFGLADHMGIVLT